MYEVPEFEESGSEWELECVKHTGKGCVCWKCESDHDDCFANIGMEDWEDE